MYKINKLCRILVLQTLFLGFSSLVFAAELPVVNVVVSDTFGYKNSVTEIKIKKQINYGVTKEKVEDLIIDEPHEISKSNSGHLSPAQSFSIFGMLAPLYQACWFMAECHNEKGCTLLRTKSGDVRTKFEDRVVKLAMSKLNKSEKFDYIGVASAFELLPDIRVLLMLKRAGFKIGTIHLIDPIFVSFVEVSKGLNMEGQDVFSPYNKKLNPNFRRYLGVFGQFLSLLFSEDDDESILINLHLSVDSYLNAAADRNNQRVIVAEDYSSKSEGFGAVSRDLDKLWDRQKGVVVMGRLPPEFSHENDLSEIYKEGGFKKKWLSHSVESKVPAIGFKQCIGCPRIEDKYAKFMRCSGCQSAIYCSRTCQVNHWETHKEDCKKAPKE